VLNYDDKLHHGSEEKSGNHKKDMLLFTVIITIIK